MADIRIEKYNVDRFGKELETGKSIFCEDCVKIINSHEREKGDFEEKVMEFLSDSYEHFTANKHGCAYILYVNNAPTSMCMFANTNFDNDTLCTEMIYTHKDKIGCGYARRLFDYALADLAQNKELNSVTSTIELNNEKSLDLHAHFTNENVKVSRDDTRIQYEFPLKAFRKDSVNNLEEVEEKTM